MTNELTLICDACRSPISEEAGYLWVDRAEVDKAEEALAAWRRKYTVNDEFGEGIVTNTVGELLEQPEPVRWMAHHGMCDPHRSAMEAYSIEAGVIRTWKQLLDWTAQLMDKTWLPVTDWQDVLRGVHASETRLVVAR